jgi:hypothetical protein
MLPVAHASGDSIHRDAEHLRVSHLIHSIV